MKDLENFVKIYPGADEVGFTMLSKMSVDITSHSPTFYLVFRNASTIYYIPNYEGQPMIDTLSDQLMAAGGKMTNDSATADIILLVNNFSTKQQIEAPDQPTTGSMDQFDMFLPFLTMQGKVFGMADIRYSNGADILFCKWILLQHKTAPYHLSMDHFAYAGWNTDGNTLGTVLSNSVLLHLFQRGVENTYFNELRLLEDWHWQAGVRQEINNYISQVNGAEASDLQPHLGFYTEYSFLVLQSLMEDLSELFELPWKLNAIYYPWLRTFEIGFKAS